MAIDGTLSTRPSDMVHETAPRNRSSGLATFVALGLLAGLAATTGAAILPADRATRWNPGLNAVGGIAHRTKICARIEAATFGNGASDATAAIQDALDACPENQVVELSSGIFQVSPPGLEIRRSGITLRGAGPDSTRIVQTLGAPYPVAIIGTRWYKWDGQTAFAADAVKGTDSVALTTDPGLKVGELVHVDETYDSALTWYNADGGQVDDYLGWGEGRTGPRGESRPIGQAMEIAAIHGKTIVFTTPFHATYRVSHAAHLARITDGSQVVVPTRYSGIEDLAVANGGGGDGGGNIRVFASAYCWARNIESSGSDGASFAFDGSFRCELRDSYLHSARNPNPGGGGYGLVFDTYSADCLAENNISWNFNKVMVMRGSGGGNVIAYNYMQDGYGGDYPNQVENGLNASHMATPHHELFEGNESFNFHSESRWGNSIAITVFRNHLTASRIAAPPLEGYVHVDQSGSYYFEDEYNRRAAGIDNGHWWYSFVGNVLGYDGMTLLAAPRSNYKVPQTSWVYEDMGDDNAVPMWKIDRTDPKVRATVLRHGNFDYATHSLRWDSTIADHAIPASLYLSAKPSFFGCRAWPWVRPEDPARIHSLPAKERFLKVDSCRAPTGLAGSPAARAHAADPRLTQRGSILEVELAAPASVRLETLDLLGRIVQSERLGMLAAGTHRLPLRIAADGVHVVRVRAGDRISTGRILVR